MKVSYLVTCSTETDTLRKLFDVLVPSAKQMDDGIIVLYDTDISKKMGKDHAPTIRIIQAFADKMQSEIFEKDTCHIFNHALENNYGAHKNFGIEQCKGDFIFQIDGDELPPEALLGENLHALLESNPTIEAYAVPRINDFRGVADEHAKKWGWRLTPSPLCENRSVVNFPDYQWRIFKRDYPRISFTRRLHEKIEGYNTYVVLPADEDYALYHDKTIEKQIETNLKYNEMFTIEENQGHVVLPK